MNLNGFVAQNRRMIFEALQAGQEPTVGTFDPKSLREARSKGAPQMGSILYFPDEIRFEFIYPDPSSAATVLSIVLRTPERIVFMAVPSWVVEQIWQGEVTGSFQFEGDANRMLAEYAEGLAADTNRAHFG